MLRLFSRINKTIVSRMSFSIDQSNRVHSFGTKDDETSYEATVHSTKLLSSTVRQFFLSIDDPLKTFRFQPGMFLDFYFSPDITSIITGFSICNSPLNYSKTNLIELAIKETDYPPTKHMFNQCQVNEKIRVKPGGDFFYDSHLTNNDSILLICAGIGANPIVSILRHLFDLYQSRQTNRIPHRVQFFYTAGKQEDLVFRQSIDLSCQPMIEDNFLRTNYFVTREINDDIKINNRRMTKVDLEHAIEWLEKPVTTYLCGPQVFIDSVENILRDLHVKKIFYEKWW